MFRRRARAAAGVIGAVAAGVTLAGCGGIVGDALRDDASAADYPADTVTILCSSEPGSPVDTMARTLADALNDTGFESPVVVETVTGGDGAVALASLVGKAANGYTLYAMTRSQAVLLASGDLDAVKPDNLDYLTRLQDDPYVWVTRSDSGLKDMADVKAAISKSGKVTVGGFGAQSAHQLAGARIAAEGDLDVTWVPYAGGSEAVTAVLGGDVVIANTNPGNVLEQVRAGDLRVLGVATDERISDLSEVPTFQEQGIDYVGSHWRGIVAKAGLPDGIEGELGEALQAAYETPRFQRLLEEQAVLPGFMDTADFSEYVVKDVQDSEALLDDITS